MRDSWYANSMCTVVLLYRPQHRWPLILAGNRDEMQNRPALPPGAHWSDHPDTIAGLDQLAGGSWLGMNRQGVVSVVMNREGTLGPQAGKRSRGELVLQALDCQSAAEAAELLARTAPADYRAFNLVIADSQQCLWIKNPGEQLASEVEIIPVPPGLHMLTAHELDDESSPRIRSWLGAFRQAPYPKPGQNQWQNWIDLLGERSYPNGLEPTAAMNVALESGFATVSSTLIALPADTSGEKPLWLFAPGPPDQTAFQPVVL